MGAARAGVAGAPPDQRAVRGAVGGRERNVWRRVGARWRVGAVRSTMVQSWVIVRAALFGRRSTVVWCRFRVMG